MEEKKEKIIYLYFDIRLISKDNEKIWSIRTGRPFLSEKFRAFENNIIWQAKSQYKGKPLDKDLMMFIIAYYKNKRHADCSNLQKGICDALQNGVVYINDRQIKKLMVEVIENSEKDYFEVFIKEINDPTN
jgi:Holliday junction resolvase RusA-like endonuclease